MRLEPTKRRSICSVDHRVQPSFGPKLALTNHISTTRKCQDRHPISFWVCISTKGRLNCIWSQLRSSTLLCAWESCRIITGLHILSSRSPTIGIGFGTRSSLGMAAPLLTISILFSESSFLTCLLLPASSVAQHIFSAFHRDYFLG